jgi:transcription termination/antitermination protein NusA
MEAKLSADEIGYISLFEKMTGAFIKDCMTSKEINKIVFVVKKGDMGLAIGKKGINIQKVRQVIGKKVEVFEYSDDPVEFVKNLFHPLRVKNVFLTENMDKKIVHVDIDDRDKAMARGKNNMMKVKMLAKRHHKISNIIMK